MTDWKCWLDGDSENGAVDVLGSSNAERAAREFVDYMLGNGDCTDCVDNYPLDVFVKSDDGSVEKFEVTVETERRISANRIPQLHEDTE